MSSWKKRGAQSLLILDICKIDTTISYETNPTLQGKGLVEEVIAKVFSVTRLVKIFKKTLIQPLSMVLDVLVKDFTKKYYN